MGCVSNTPIEYSKAFDLFVKREDLACPFPGPAFSKTRGVFAHLLNRPERYIGALDARHSRNGHATAWACKILGKKCYTFFTSYAKAPGPRENQLLAAGLGSELHPLAGTYAAIQHVRASRIMEDTGDGYMLPIGLRVPEMVTATAEEARLIDHEFDWVILPAASGTIAAGVIQGMRATAARFIVYLSYKRDLSKTLRYFGDLLGQGFLDDKVEFIHSDYEYKDAAEPGPTPTWPCCEYYELKAFRWWLQNRRRGKTLFWNAG